MLVGDPARQAAYGVVVADVGRLGQEHHAARGRDAGSRRGQPLRVEVGEDEMPSLGGDCLRGGPADPAGGTGDEDAEAVEVT